MAKIAYVPVDVDITSGEKFLYGGVQYIKRHFCVKFEFLKTFFERATAVLEMKKIEKSRFLTFYVRPPYGPQARFCKTVFLCVQGIPLANLRPSLKFSNGLVEFLQPVQKVQKKIFFRLFHKCRKTPREA